jgi:hypothetical protein
MDGEGGGGGGEGGGFICDRKRARCLQTSEVRPNTVVGEEGGRRQDNGGRGTKRNTEEEEMSGFRLRLEDDFARILVPGGFLLDFFEEEKRSRAGRTAGGSGLSWVIHIDFLRGRRPST